MKARQGDATVTPHLIINDTRTASRPQSVKKLLMTEPENRVVKAAKIEPAKKQNYTSFVSDFARIHGINYKEALKSTEVKNLYKSYNRQQNGQEFFVKHSYEQKRPVYTPNPRKVGETIFVDQRMSTDEYEPKQIKELEKSQQKLQIARGLYSDLKRNYLNDVRADFVLSNYFRTSGHTQESFSPLTDQIVKSILEGAIKQRTKNIFSISPFIEMSILLHSYDKFESLLKSANRNLIETPLTTFAEESIRRLNSSLEAMNNTDEFDSSDTFFFNTSSYYFGNRMITDIIAYKLSNDQKNFDVYFTDASKKWNTLADFYNSDLGEKLVFAIGRGTDASKRELLASLRDAKFSQGILQEDSNYFLSNLNQTFENIAGDQRALLTQMMQTKPPAEEQTKPPAEPMMYYKYTGSASKLRNGDFFKINRTSNSIFKFNSTQLEAPTGKFRVYVYDLNDDVVRLEKTYAKKNFVRVSFLREGKSENVVSIEKLAETLSEPSITAIFLNEEQPIKDEAEYDDETTDVSDVGEGMFGGSLVKDVSEFKKIFNPDFKYVGRSGIEHVYKLSF